MTQAVKRSNKIRQGMGDRIFGIINFFLVTLLIIFMIYPFYYCIILAFNDGYDAMKPGIYFWPRMFTLENFKNALSADGLLQAGLMSVLRTVIGTFCTVMVTAAFAYAATKPQLRFRKFYFVFMMIPMYFGGGLVPTYYLFQSMGILNTFWIYILPGLFSVYYALIFMAFFRELPPSLEESAMLDGASHITMFFRLILPLSMPVIAAVCVFLAVGHWNSWMDTLYYARDNEHVFTLAYKFSQTAQQVDYLNKLAQEAAGEAAKIGQELRGSTSISIQLASMLISVVPVMAVYPFFQKYFVHGVMIGAVKG